MSQTHATKPKPPAPKAKSKKRARDDGNNNNDGSSSRNKRRRATAFEQEDLDLDLEAGLNTKIALLDSMLLADHLAQKTRRFGTDLKPVELSALDISREFPHPSSLIPLPIHISHLTSLHFIIFINP